MTDLRLVIFDVDGTLVDSQAHIVASMSHAFWSVRLSPPSRQAALSIVGLSLPEAMARLAPEQPASVHDALVAAYKEGFAGLRASGNPDSLSPLFPGAMAALQALAAQDHTWMAIATGKSRRGLNHIFDTHNLRPMFQSAQCADDHPSKPHPSMVEACLADTGVAVEQAVIIGDTTYDIDMGRAAGIHALGVSWGYHPVADLTDAGATAIIDRFEQLPAALDAIWGTR